MLGIRPRSQLVFQLILNMLDEVQVTGLSRTAELSPSNENTGDVMLKFKKKPSLNCYKFFSTPLSPYMFCFYIKINLNQTTRAQTPLLKQPKIKSALKYTDRCVHILLAILCKISKLEHPAENPSHLLGFTYFLAQIFPYRSS